MDPVHREVVPQEILRLSAGRSAQDEICKGCPRAIGARCRGRCSHFSPRSLLLVGWIEPSGLAACLGHCDELRQRVFAEIGGYRALQRRAIVLHAGNLPIHATGVARGDRPRQR